MERPQQTQQRFEHNPDISWSADSFVNPLRTNPEISQRQDLMQAALKIGRHRYRQFKAIQGKDDEGSCTPSYHDYFADYSHALAGYRSRGRIVPDFLMHCCRQGNPDMSLDAMCYAVDKKIKDPEMIDLFAEVIRKFDWGYREVGGMILDIDKKIKQARAGKAAA